MKLGRAVGDERDIARVALILDALARHRGLLGEVEHLAIELVHRGDIGAAQVDVMQLELHGVSPLASGSEGLMAHGLAAIASLRMVAPLWTGTAGLIPLPHSNFSLSL